jgi:hypothetical protein
MNPFSELLGFDALAIVLGAVVVLHRNHLRRPQRAAVKPKPVKAPEQTGREVDRELAGDGRRF